MRVTYNPVRVIHWDRPQGAGYAEFDSDISVTLSFDCITIKDELLFKLEERFRTFILGTKVQTGSWIAEQEILIKFNEGPKTAMTNSLKMIKEAQENFNACYVETMASDGSVSGDMTAPNDENMVKMAEKIVSVAKEEGLLRGMKKV